VVINIPRKVVKVYHMRGEKICDSHGREVKDLQRMMRNTKGAIVEIRGEKNDI